MITCNPVRLNMSNVVSSSVSYPEVGETAWSAATTYALGATVSYQINGTWHKFESKSNGNLNQTPQAYPLDADNSWWIDLGYVNQISLFQLERNTQTVAASPYSIRVAPNDRVGAIGIGNIDADTVTLNLYDAGVLIRTFTQELKRRNVFDWFSWTYQPFYQVRGTIFTGLPINATYQFELIFTSGSGTVKVGMVVPGVPLDIGRALVGTSIKSLNYSSFERDEFGESKVTIRRNIPKHEYTLLIQKSQMNNVKRLLDDLNGLVTFWAGIVETQHGYFDSVFLIGLYKDVSYQINLPEYVNGSIEIEAL